MIEIPKYHGTVEVPRRSIVISYGTTMLPWSVLCGLYGKTIQVLQLLQHITVLPSTMVFWNPESIIISNYVLLHF